MYIELSESKSSNENEIIILCVFFSDQLQDFQLKNSSLLLGGEAALWTEYADDENIISRLWCVQAGVFHQSIE